MLNYNYLYRKGVKHLDDDVKDVIRALRQNENVCLCSPNMGDTRLIDYIAYTLENHSEWRVIYDQDGTVSHSQLIDLDRNEDGEKSLLLVPHFARKNEIFIRTFDKIMSHKVRGFQSIVAMEYDFLDNPSKYFSNGAPMSTVIIRRPLSFTMARSVIESRRLLNNWKIPHMHERKIHQLSGGVISLLKHICGFYDKKQTLNESDLLLYPPVVRTLADIKMAFDILDESNLSKLGYVRTNGDIRGLLLKRYIQSGSKTLEPDLSPELEKLYTLFKDHEGSILSIEEIDERLNREEEISLWAIYKLISRLRKELIGEYEIKNYKGKGYMLRKNISGT